MPAPAACRRASFTSLILDRHSNLLQAAQGQSMLHEHICQSLRRTIFHRLQQSRIMLFAMFKPPIGLFCLGLIMRATQFFRSFHPPSVVSGQQLALGRISGNGTNFTAANRKNDRQNTSFMRLAHHLKSNLALSPRIRLQPGRGIENACSTSSCETACRARCARFASSHWHFAIRGLTRPV
jgi:hypothetical protein